MNNSERKEELDKLRFEVVIAEAILEGIQETHIPIVGSYKELLGIVRAYQKNMEMKTLRLYHEINLLAEHTEETTDPNEPLPFDEGGASE